jgi:hypothetical protein
MKIQLSPEQKFIANFIQFYQDMANHPDTVIQVLLDRLHDEACDLQSNRLGESIDRVIKFYKIKSKKKKAKRIN